MSRRAFATAGTYEFGYRHPDTEEICEPNPKQRLAHDSTADWLFYGGAVGGGKTSWLAVAAVKHCLLYRGAQAALFRRTHADLEKSIVLELLRIVPPHLAYFNRGLMRFEFLNGSLLWLCYCRYESDVYQYQSAQWSFLGIDECTHFTEFILRYLITRVRSPKKHVPKQVRFGSNPGGPGHGVMKRWFLRPTAKELGGQPLPGPMDIWTPERPDWWPKHLPVPSRQFIPAKFEDNTVLQEADPGYLANVYQLGGDKARQLAEGDWDANESMIIGAEWREFLRVEPGDPITQWGLEPGTVIPWHVIPRPDWKPPKDALLYGSVDYGYGAPWAFHLHAGLTDYHARTFYEIYEARVRDAQQARKIRRVLEDHDWHPEWIVMDPQMWNDRSEVGMKSIADVYEEELGLPCKLILLKGAGGRPARMSRPNRWKAALARGADGFPNWTVTTACPELIRTVPEVPWDEEDPEVEDDDAENHCYEDVGRFFEARPFAPAPSPLDRLSHLDPISRAHHEAMAKRTHGQRRKRRTVGRRLTRH